jgi:hypothetical protein
LSVAWLAAELEKRSAALGRPAATVAARCRALVRAARGEVQAALEEIDRSLANVGDVPEPLTLARTLIVKGSWSGGARTNAMRPRHCTRR